MANGRLGFEDVARPVERLPSPFREDTLVVKNLAPLQRDCRRWPA
jgi:hypothetical protein